MCPSFISVRLCLRLHKLRQTLKLAVRRLVIHRCGTVLWQIRGLAPGPVQASKQVLNRVSQ